MFYETPGDQLDSFIFDGDEVPIDEVKKGGFFLIRLKGERYCNIGNTTTYGKEGIASLFEFVSGPNEFGNLLFQDRDGCKLLIKEFTIRFHKSS